MCVYGFMYSNSEECGDIRQAFGHSGSKFSWAAMESVKAKNPNQICLLKLTLMKLDESGCSSKLPDWIVWHVSKPHLLRFYQKKPGSNRVSKRLPISDPAAHVGFKQHPFLVNFCSHPGVWHRLMISLDGYSPMPKG